MPQILFFFKLQVFNVLPNLINALFSFPCLSAGWQLTGLVALFRDWSLVMLIEKPHPKFHTSFDTVCYLSLSPATLSFLLLSHTVYSHFAFHLPDSFPIIILGGTSFPFHFFKKISEVTRFLCFLQQESDFDFRLCVQMISSQLA